MIAVVDYGSGNIHAINNIYKRLKIECKFVSKPDQLAQASRIILAGVGAFDESMRQLNSSGMREALDHCVLENKVPVLGICVGMQIMALSSEEGDLPGLGWIPARVKRFDEEALHHKPKTPHMGWNTARPQLNHQLYNDVDVEQGFYFLHSYYFECDQGEDVLALTTYGEEFASAVHRRNVHGVQFHPEKSHQNGVNLLKNFAEMSGC